MAVISRMTSARAGAAIVVDEAGVLAGIFTQGDFARAFQSGRPDIGNEAVGGLMTRNPISVHESKLVGEVLRILEDSRIDDLVVLNDARVPRDHRHAGSYQAANRVISMSGPGCEEKLGAVGFGF